MGSDGVSASGWQSTRLYFRQPVKATLTNLYTLVDWKRPTVMAFARPVRRQIHSSSSSRSRILQSHRLEDGYFEDQLNGRPSNRISSVRSR